MSKLSKNLKKLRENLGLTQEQVAILLGLTRGAYQSYEKYRAEPSLKTIVKMAKLFKVKIQDLINKEL